MKKRHNKRPYLSLKEKTSILLIQDKFKKLYPDMPESVAIAISNDAKLLNELNKTKLLDYFI